MALSAVFENKLIDWLLRAQAIGVTGATAAAGTGPANVYMALLTAVPSNNAGTGLTECAGTNYARATVVSSLANWAGTQGLTTTVASSGTSGQTSNNAAVTFPTPGATGTAWGTINGWAVYDALTGGNMLMYGSLTVAKTIALGDAAPSFPISAFTLTLS
jgi:hypothetical protein